MAIHMSPTTANSMTNGSLPSTNVYHFRRHDIGWKDLNKSKFYLIIPCASVTVRGILFPLHLVKTQLQSRELNHNITMRSICKRIVQNEGIAGFYKGFGVSMIGLINSPIYTSAFEASREIIYDKLQQTNIHDNYNINNETLHTLSAFTGGIFATCAVQTVQTPIEVISQKRMVLLHSETNKSPLLILRELLNENVGDSYSSKNSNIFNNRYLVKTRQFFGLWRGFSLGLISHAPKSAIIWSTFFINKNFFYSILYSNKNIENIYNYNYNDTPQWQKSLITFISAGMAGGIAAWITMPLDTVS